MRTDPVSPIARRVAAFLADYRLLCEHHGAMVCHARRENEDGSVYTRFAVAILEHGGDDLLGKALDEMLIGSAVRFSWPDPIEPPGRGKPPTPPAA